jgi:hypothetical protein
MPAMPWKALGQIDPQHGYLALLTFLPLRSRWRIPGFMIHTRRIAAQLQQTPRVVGFALFARPLRGHFWTLFGVGKRSRATNVRRGRRPCKTRCAQSHRIWEQRDSSAGSCAATRSLRRGTMPLRAIQGGVISGPALVSTICRFSVHLD